MITQKKFHFLYPAILILVVACFCFVLCMPFARASYLPTTGSNIGIGTSTPVGAFTVLSGNVGIGTWSPTSRLQVVGTVAATAFTGDGSGLTGVSAGGWTDGGTNVYLTTTTDNVGIGTTTPTSTVEIVKTAAATAPLMVSTTATADGDLFVIASDGSTGIGTTTPIGGTAIMNGNVGIGTWSPNSKLIVMGGNVGIGTAFPDAQLNLLKTSASTTPDTEYGANFIFSDTGAVTTLTDYTYGIRNSVTRTGGSGGSFNTYGNYTSVLGDTGGSSIATGYRASVSGADWNIGFNANVFASTAITRMQGYLATISDTSTAANDVYGGWFDVYDGGVVTSGTDNNYGAYYQVERTGATGGTFNTYGLYSLVRTDAAGAGTSTAYGLYVDTGTILTTNADTVYGQYISTEANAGTTAYGLFVDAGTAAGTEYSGIFLNGNVGIGTVTPTGMLDVRQDEVRIWTGAGTDTNATSAGELYVEGDLEVDGTLYGDGSGLTGTSGLTVAGGWTDGGTNVYTSITTDNVGIGTTTPASTLTIAGNIGIGTTTPYRTIAGPTNGIVAEGNVGIGTFAAAHGKLIVMGGNVGIGTIIPGYPLEVSSGYTSIFGRSSSGVALEAGVAGYNSNFGAGVYGASDMGNGVSASTNSSSSTAAGLLASSWGTGPAVYGQAWNGISGYFQSMNNANTSATLVTQQQGALTGDLFQVLNAAGGVLVGVKSNGNVGIGTITPIQKLSVIGKALIGTSNDYDAGSTLSLLDLSNRPWLSLDTADNQLKFGAGNSAEGAAIVTEVGSLYFKSGGTDTAHPITTGTVQMTIAQDGNIGIGTDAPRGKLIVAGGNVGIGTLDPVGALTVMNGNVGIGTWSPTSRLQVVGTVAATAFTGDGSGLTGIAAGGWTDGGTNVYTATTTDNVGIGTTTPNASTLEIVKNAAQPALKISSTATANGDYLVVKSDGNVGIGTTAPRGALVVLNGNVGLGTTSPGSTLDVLGSINVPYSGAYRMNGSDVIKIMTGPFVANSNLFVGSPSGTLDTADAWANTTLGVLAGDAIVDGYWNTAIGWNAGTSITDGNNNTIIGAGSGTLISTGYLNTVLGSNALNNLTTSFSNIAVGSGAGSALTTGNNNILIGNDAQTTTAGDYSRLNIGDTIYGDLLAGNVGIGTWNAAGGKLIVTGGNVGVGTVLPNYSFHVKGTGLFSNVNEGRILLRDEGAPVSRNSFEISKDGDGLAFSSMDNSFAYATQNIMVIDYSGNVGFGDPFPDAAIDAVGALMVSSGVSGDGDRFIINGSGNVGIGTVAPVGALTVMNGNVGIGTWSPTQRLQVVGTVAATAFTGDGSALTGIAAGGWTDGGTNVYTSTTTDNVGIGTTTPTAALLVQNAGTQASFRVNDSVLDGTPFIINSAGNVGIGTTTPIYPLHVIGRVNLGDGAADSGADWQISQPTFPYFTLEYFTGVTFSLGVHDAGAQIAWDGGNLEMKTGQTWNAHPGVSGITRMTITQVGNVGVGTTTPASRFVVNGGVGIGTINTSAFILAAAPSGGLIVERNVGIGTTTPVGALTIMNGNVGIGTWSPGSGFNIIGGNIGIGTTTQYRRIAAPTNGMAIEGNVGIGTWAAANGKLIVMGGNVGIGVINPNTSLLNVSDNTSEARISYNAGGNFSGVYASGGNCGGSYCAGIYGDTTSNPNAVVRGAFISLANTNGTGLHVESGTVTTGRLVYFFQDTSAYASDMLFANMAAGSGSFTGKFLNFQKNSVTQFSVNNNGNVGIGTVTAVDSLTVIGGNVGIGTTTPYRFIAGPSNGLVAEGNVGIGTWAANEKLIVMGGNVGVGTTTPVGALTVMNGNVGIGTWSPTSILQVIGTVNATAFVGDGSGLTGVSGGASGWTDGGTNVYTTTTTDLVAIGTTTPASFLTVKGNVGIGTTTPYITIAAPANGMIAEGNVGIGTFAASSGKLVVMGGNVGIGTVTPVGALTVMNGNVGIGTWSPTQRLQVVGTVAATAFTGDGSALTGIAAGGWADGGTNVYTTTTTDNVGIGTTTPTAALLVENAGSQDSFRVNDAALDDSPFIVDANGNVGIGTLYPNFPLQVLGGIRLGLDGEDGDSAITSGGGVILHANDTGTDPSSEYLFLKSGPVGGVGYIELYTNQISRMMIDPVGNIGIGTSTPEGAFTIMNGNVGIGTWRPTARLQVIGTVNATAFVGDGSGLTGIGAGASGWTDVGTNIYNTLTSDRVGIGTTTPSVPLEVVTPVSGIALETSVGTFSSFAINHDSAGTTFYINGDGSVPGDLGLGFSGTFENTPSATHIFKQSGNVGIGTINPVGALTVMNGNVGIGTWSPVDTLSIVGNIGIGTTLPYRRIAAPNNGMVVEGNVGIGTWNPTKKLQVFGDALVKSPVNSATAFEVQTSSGTAILSIDTSTSYTSLGGGLSAANPISGINGDATNPTFTFTNDPNTGIFGSGGSDLLGFTTNGVERMRIISSGNIGIGTSSPVGGLAVMNGNVGIGTWSPTQRLQVIGTVDATAFVGDGSGLTGVSGGASGWTDGGTNVYTTTTTDLVAIGTTTPASALTVKGNVGIGTTTPYATIAAPANGMIVEGNVGVGTFAANNGKLIIMGGNVGIGSSAPQNAIEIYANASGVDLGVTSRNAHVLGFATDLYYNDATQYAAVGIGGTSTSTGYAGRGYLYSDSNTFGLSIISTGAGRDIRFYTAGPTAADEKIRIDGNGNLGIGTTSPVGGMAVMNGNVGIGTWSPGARLQVNNTASFSSEYNNGTQAVNFTIDWNNGNKQRVTLGAAGLVVTLTAPSGGVANVMLKIIQDGTGSRTIASWPGTVRWPGGTAPTLTTTAGAVDIVTCYYDRTNYFCTNSLDFQ